MANDVFANGREVSCKKADGKTICAFPDICMTPPTSPATPTGVPIPYPNTGMAKDTANGSRSVKITGKEIVKKNVSYYKTSYGDEAGCATPAKKGIITGTIKGKVYFVSWSMDVKIEGKNVVRHLDMTTHNHACPTANESIPWPHLDSLAIDIPSECAKQAKNARKRCKNAKLILAPQKDKHGNNKTRSDNSIIRKPDGVECSKACKKAMRCILVPKKKDKEMCCRGDTTGHHLIEDHWIKGNSNFPNYISYRLKPKPNITPTQAHQQGKVTEHDAPCVCANANRYRGRHKKLHDIQGVYEESFMSGRARHDPSHPSGGFTYGEGRNAALLAHKRTFKSCPEKCIGAQLDKFYGDDTSRPLNSPEKQPLGESRATTIKKWGAKVSG